MKNPEVYSSFKGMNRQSDISNMSPEYLYDIFNGYVTKDSAIKKRFGYEKKFATAIQEGGEDVDIIAYYEAVYDDESRDYFACTADHIYKWNSGGSSWDDLKTLSSSCSFVSIAQYGDDVVFSDGVNATQKFTKGGVATADFTMPSGVTTFKLVHVHNNRMWGITTDNVPHYSALGNIEDWTTSGDAGAGYLNLLAYVNHGDSIQSLATFSKAYICFFMTEHVITYAIGTVASDFQILQTTVNTGVKSSHSTMSFGNDLFYLDNDSPKSFIASTTSQELDTNDITKGILGNYYRDLIYAASGQRICLTKHTRRSWILAHIPIGNSGEILLWDYAYGIWSGRWRLADKVNSIFEDRDGNLCFASTGYIYKFNISAYSDDGDAIEFYVNTPFYYGSDALAFERIPYIEFVAETQFTGTQVEVSVYFEYEGSPSTYEVKTIDSAGSLWDESLWDSALWDVSGQNIYRTRVIGRGKMHRLTFRNTQDDKDLDIKLFKVFKKNLGNN
jgi:hypothetical protein